MRVWKLFREFRTIINSIDLEFHDEQLEAFAPRAYAQCVKWYGVPMDADRPFQIVGGPIGGTSRNPFSGHYIISIPSYCSTLEQRVAVLSHEMYHRFTCRRKGLRRQMWVDEMMAEMTERKILREEGFAYYADYLQQFDEQCPSLLDAQALRRAVKRKSIFLRSFGLEFPEEYGPSVIALGRALEQLVGWRPMCQLVFCRTWKEWLVAVSPEVREQVCQLLAIS